MFSTLVRRSAEAAKTRVPIPTNYSRPAKLKKVWPPDFKKLSHQEKLKFEKRWKRRVVLATRRPLWDKSWKLVQYLSITFVVIYAVLFMEDAKGIEGTPFDGFRDWFFGQFKRGGTSSPEEKQAALDASPISTR